MGLLGTQSLKQAWNRGPSRERLCNARLSALSALSAVSARVVARRRMTADNADAADTVGSVMCLLVTQPLSSMEVPYSSQRLRPMKPVNRLSALSA